MSALNLSDTQPTVDDVFWQLDYEPITESDTELADLVQKADLPALLAALAAVTGDVQMLRRDLRPPCTPVDTVNHPHGGMSLEQQAEARVVALQGLKRLRDEALSSVRFPSEDEIEEILSYLSNGNTDWHAMLRHELNLTPGPGNVPKWNYAQFAEQGQQFSVLIVGAGVAGIAAAYRFAQAGVPYTLIEATESLGGTWHKNCYPGVRLDTPTFGYSYSFAQRADWPHQFAQGHEVLEYLHTVAQQAGIEQRIQFGTKLLSSTWNEESGQWITTVLGPSGVVEERSYNAVISASGQLDLPNIPKFPGQERYEGNTMHSQQWDPGVDWAGKRVAVIGTGASAYQIVPAIVDSVEKLVVFQRSAPWMLPAPTYHEPMTDTFDWLMRKVPHYAQFFRLWVIVLGIPGRLHTVRAEADWEHAPLSVSQKNHEVRKELIRRLEEQFTGHPQLLERAIPSYPPGSKRMLRDNGVWAEALTAEHTVLETSPIREFTPTGLVTEDGTHHEVDLVVYATGFKPSDYLDGIKVTGRKGQDLHEYWQGDARAYNGVTVPGFPNFFMIYGPNVGGVVSGSLHFMLERASEYALKTVHEVLQRKAKAADVTESALERFVQWIDAENQQMAWGQPYIRTWYQNSKGRVSQVWPFTNIEYWQITEAVNIDDYEFLV